MGDGPGFKGIGGHGYRTGGKERSFYLNFFGTTDSPHGSLTCLGSRQRLEKNRTRRKPFEMPLFPHSLTRRFSAKAVVHLCVG